MPLCFRLRISQFGAASKASSCVCASLSLPCSPAGGRDGACLPLDQVVRCSSAGGAMVRVWRPGVLYWSPVRLTLLQLESSHSTSTHSRWLLSGFLPPTAGRSFIGGTSACSGPLPWLTAISLAFGLATAVFRCGGGFPRGY